MSKIRVHLVIEYEAPNEIESYGTNDVHEIARQDAESLDSGLWSIDDLVSGSQLVSVKFEGAESSALPGEGEK